VLLSCTKGSSQDSSCCEPFARPTGLKSSLGTILYRENKNA